jgi:hypothetical protein
MDKKILFLVVAIAVIAVASSIIIYQLEFTHPPIIPLSDSENNSFNILFRYGIGAKNELNTYNGTYTKDLVINGTVTTNLTLSQEELTELQYKIAEMGLWSYPESFSRNPFSEVTPPCDWYLKMDVNGKIKVITWNSNSLIESNIQQHLDQVTDYLTGLIEQKPEYQVLPNAEGGYL